MIESPQLRFSGRRTTPLFRSAETAECGLACAAMVAAYHGRRVDLNSLRQTTPISLAGMTLKGLGRILDSLGLSHRAIRLELAALKRLPTPAILHWDMNHFVVLTGWSGRKAVVNDPQAGTRVIDAEELSRRFTGVALEIAAHGDWQGPDSRVRIRLSSLWSSARGLWSSAGQVALLTICLQLVAVALPLQLQLIIDQAIPSNDTVLLLTICLAFAGVFLVHYLIQALRDWTLQIVGGLFSYQLIGNVVHHMMRLPITYFETRHVGDLLSRLGSANSIRDVLTRNVVGSIIDGLMAIIIIVVIFWYSALLGVIAVLGTALGAAVSTVAYSMIRKRTEEQLVESASEQSLLMENVRAAAVIRLHGEEPQREARWREAFASSTNATIALGKYQIGLRLALSVLNGVQTILIIYLASRQVMTQSDFTLGMLIAFLAYRQLLADRVAALIESYLQLRLLALHLERLSDIVLTDREDPGDAAPLSKVDGRVALQDVSFRYGATDRPVLEGISLEIEDGEFVAFTGPSGQGKTTLFKLLVGALHPSSGSVLLDGQAATPALWREWRRYVGVVSQDDRLLTGSIADNIAFFDPQLDMNRVADAARLAHVHIEIEQMPMRYQTLVGDMGAALSGGQKQRVLLARALYRQPRLLMLDEGTANLDLVSEERIAASIAELAITRIVVAHRPALLGRADRVIYVERGKLVTQMPSTAL